MATFSLVVPVWNEATRLKETGPDLVAFVDARGGELVIADDGSTDATVAVARELGVSVVEASHLGKGAAVRNGIHAARGDVVAFCDVDLATSLADLERLINLAAADDVVVIGSRAVAESALDKRESMLRENLGRAFNKLVQLALVRGVRDTQCGAKAARRHVWQKLLTHSAENGFAWDVEVLAFARALRIPIVEVGVAWSHQPGSRVRVASDGIAMVRAVPRIWWRRRAARA